MSATNATLPPGWTEILQEIQARLEQAITSADLRIEQTAVIDTQELAHERQQDASRLEHCLHDLRAQLESTGRLVQEVDASLQIGEEAMQEQMLSCLRLRQRLADWAGRAIG